MSKVLIDNQILNDIVDEINFQFDKHYKLREDRIAHQILNLEETKNYHYGKKDPNLSANKNNIILDNTNPSVSFNIYYEGSGIISIDNLTSNIVSTNLNNNILTFSAGSNTGNFKVKINLSHDDNYRHSYIIIYGISHISI